MINKNDAEDMHDYGPNELVRLSEENPKKYKEIVSSNLEPGDTIEQWQQKNLEYMQRFLKK